MASIILLEADRQLAKHTANYFGRQGHQVRHYCELQEAITAADGQKPDVIILDMALAGRSGVEFLYELRSYPDWQHVPVVAAGRLSPDEQADFAPAFGKLGISSYLHKPAASLGSLLAAAEQLLQANAAV